MSELLSIGPVEYLVPLRCLAAVQAISYFRCEFEPPSVHA